MSLEIAPLHGLSESVRKHFNFAMRGGGGASLSRDVVAAGDDLPSRIEISVNVPRPQASDWRILELGARLRARTLYGTHTMRRIKASLIYRRARHIRAVQLLLGHTKLESTVRYLGIKVDGALEMAEQTGI